MTECIEQVAESIPSSEVIRSRLAELNREGNFLRSLLRLVERHEQGRPRTRRPRVGGPSDAA